MLKNRMLARFLVPALGVMALQTIVAEEPAAPPPPARSIHEWLAKPSPAPSPAPSPTLCPCQTATPAASEAAPTSPVTISITSSLRQGNLVVVLDGVPIFNEKFSKPLLLISQTTTWDPLQVEAGTHRLSAKVYGTKKTYFSSDYDLQLSRTKGAALRFVMRGDKLTVELAS